MTALDDRPAAPTAPDVEAPTVLRHAGHLYRRLDDEPCPLTARQLEVLTLAAEGLTRASIGTRLHVAETTVKTALERARGRAGAESTTHLVAMAIRGGWIR